MAAVILRSGRLLVVSCSEALRHDTGARRVGARRRVRGEEAIYRDLRMRLINNPDSLKALYSRTPRWLQSVMNAWADGLNYYLL